MKSESFDEFQRRLNLARNGGGILFCGAGFSADCLNFSPDEMLGTGAQLLNLFNAELNQKPPYKDLQNAADALWDKCSVPDDHIDPRRTALFMARSILREVRDGGRTC